MSLRLSRRNWNAGKQCKSCSSSKSKGPAILIVASRRTSSYVKLPHNSVRYKRLEADHNTLKQNYEKYKNQQAVNVEKALRELSETRVHLKE